MNTQVSTFRTIVELSKLSDVSIRQATFMAAGYSRVDAVAIDKALSKMVRMTAILKAHMAQASVDQNLDLIAGLFEQAKAISDYGFQETMMIEMTLEFFSEYLMRKCGLTTTIIHAEVDAVKQDSYAGVLI